MPKLSKLSDLDEDCFAWKDATVNSMGIGGFGIFLKGKSEVQRHPSIGESFFTSSSVLQCMVDKANPLPRRWSMTTSSIR